jgi:hypothetical protein
MMDRHDEASALLWQQLQTARVMWNERPSEMTLRVLLAEQEAFEQHFTETRTVQ